MKKTVVSICALLILAGCGAHRPAEAPFQGASIPWEGDHRGTVEVIPLMTGEVKVEREILVDLGSESLENRRNEEVWVPVLAYLVRHPSGKNLLIDSGFDSSFGKSGHGNFGGLARLVTLARQRAGEDTVALLRKLGVDPDGLQAILLSHLHADHTAGLPELPKDVPLVAGPSAVRSYKTLWYAPSDHLRGFSTIRTLAFPEGKPIDWFGDGSLVILPMPGHAEGNLSFLVNTPKGTTLLACDTSHLQEGLEAMAPGRAHDEEAAKESLSWIRRWRDENPEGIVKAGHDPSDWDMERGIQDPL